MYLMRLLGIIFCISLGIMFSSCKKSTEQTSSKTPIKKPSINSNQQLPNTSPSTLKIEPVVKTPTKKEIQKQAVIEPKETTQSNESKQIETVMKSILLQVSDDFNYEYESSTKYPNFLNSDTWISSSHSFWITNKLLEKNYPETPTADRPNLFSGPSPVVGENYLVLNPKYYTNQDHYFATIDVSTNEEKTQVGFFFGKPKRVGQIQSQYDVLPFKIDCDLYAKEGYVTLKIVKNKKNLELYKNNKLIKNMVLGDLAPDGYDEGYIKENIEASYENFFGIKGFLIYYSNFKFYTYQTN